MGYQEVIVQIKNDSDVKKLIETIHNKASVFGINIVAPLALFKSLKDTEYLIKNQIYLIAGGYERHVVKTIALETIPIEYVLEDVMVQLDDDYEKAFFKNDNIEYVNYNYYNMHFNMFSFKNWDKTFGKMLSIRKY